MMFHSNQKLSISGDNKDDAMLRLTLDFVMTASGWKDKKDRNKKPQPVGYTINPTKGVVLFWSEKAPRITIIPPELRNEETIVLLIRNYLTSEATANRYAELKAETLGGDSWYHHGWECYIPTSEYQDKLLGLPSDQMGYAIVGFRPCIARYDK